MKKSLFLLSLIIAFISCDNNEPTVAPIDFTGKYIIDYYAEIPMYNELNHKFIKNYTFYTRDTAVFVKNSIGKVEYVSRTFGDITIVTDVKNDSIALESFKNYIVDGNIFTTLIIGKSTYSTMYNNTLGWISYIKLSAVSTGSDIAYISGTGVMTSVAKKQ